ncbi:transposase [Clostridium beijerinckii]|nr:transposase [Clostridium beijerinckii]NYC00159.1 transposase [Clostridium beijerinckii]
MSPVELFHFYNGRQTIEAFFKMVKNVNRMPLYRQEAEFKRNGLELDRNRMSYWIVRCAEIYLSLLFEELRKQFLACQYKQADETKVRVLHEDGRKATTDSYM